jgi:putative OPT family oligopeptide transporter
MSHPIVPPQLTFKAILLGIALAIILAGANAYLGLFAGMTVSASIPAAVISMGLLRLFRDSNVLENNIVQTAASAGESVAAGAIFTLPALILLGYWNVFDYWWVCAITGLGGLLGVLFTIPLRRSLIVEQSLPFPEGTATAEVLKLGDAPGQGLRALGLAAAIGATLKFAETGLRLWPGTAQVATQTSGGTVIYAGTSVSAALLSVGYIVGFNVAVLIFAGGVLAWGIGIPLYSTWFMTPGEFQSSDAVDLAFTIWSTKIRYVGVGAMLTGGIWALISIRGSIFQVIRSGIKSGQQAGVTAVPHFEQDLPMKFVLTGIALFVAPIFALYYTIIGSWEIGLAMTGIMMVAGFLFSAVAGYMAGLVGSSNNPVSGVTIATLLVASLLLLWLTGPGATAAAAAILIGAVVCCAAAIAGDNMQDLKAGHLLGATPWKQQLMQGIGVLSAALVMAPVLNLLLSAYGMGPPTAEHPNSLAAPQANLMASVASGVLGGELPWALVAIGATTGAIIVFADELLRRSRSALRCPVLAVAVGIYLPLELSVPICAGGIIAWLANRKHAGSTISNNGMLFAAGLITGEALVGILIAIPIVLTSSPNVLALPDKLHLGPLAGLIALLLVGTRLLKVARASG